MNKFLHSIFLKQNNKKWKDISCGVFLFIVKFLREYPFNYKYE